MDLPPSSLGLGGRTIGEVAGAPASLKLSAPCPPPSVTLASSAARGPATCAGEPATATATRAAVGLGAANGRSLSGLFSPKARMHCRRHSFSLAAQTATSSFAKEEWLARSFIESRDSFEQGRLLAERHAEETRLSETATAYIERSRRLSTNGLKSITKRGEQSVTMKQATGMRVALRSADFKLHAVTAFVCGFHMTMTLNMFTVIWMEQFSL